MLASVMAVPTIGGVFLCVASMANRLYSVAILGSVLLGIICYLLLKAKFQVGLGPCTRLMALAGA